MDNELVNGYSKNVIGYLSMAPVFDEWRDARETLMMRLAEDEPWMHALPVISCQAVGGNPSSAIPVAAAWITMYHAANLIDDLGVENLQPGDPALHPETAMIVSLAWLFAAMQILSEPGPDVRAKLRVMTLFSQAGFDSTVGQFQVRQGKAQQTGNAEPLYNYWRSTILKSGSIYRAGTAGGAAIGTDSNPQIESLGDYGIALGVIRQVLDDCQDISSDAADENKNLTLPLLLYALKGDQRAETGNRFDKLTDPFTVHSSVENKSLITEAGIPEIIAEILMEWRRRALDSLRAVKPSRARESLAEILEYVLSLPMMMS